MPWLLTWLYSVDDIPLSFKFMELQERVTTLELEVRMGKQISNIEIATTIPHLFLFLDMDRLHVKIWVYLVNNVNSYKKL